MPSRTMLDAQRAYHVDKLHKDADSLGIDRQAWVRLADLAVTDSIAQAVVEKIRQAHLHGVAPTADVLSLLLADVVDIASTYRAQHHELAMCMPAPSIFIPIKDDKDDHSG